MSKVKSSNKSDLDYHRRIVGRKLAYYGSTADASFWDSHWKENFDDSIYSRAEQGFLGELKNPFLRYLPKDAPFLEAGCGLGQYVLALKKLGYQAEGVEWGQETVDFALQKYPDLPIRKGDVTRLQVPDNYYGGYISLGVVEHLPDGPQPFLQEAYRILRPGGVALISVPYFNPLRQLKASWGMYQDPVDGLSFYQYAYSEEELREIYSRSGFAIVDRFPLSTYKGVTDEIPLLRTVSGWKPMRMALQGFLSVKVFRNLGHSILIVLQKS